jgi:HlyD family secretion protein
MRSCFRHFSGGLCFVLGLATLAQAQPPALVTVAPIIEKKNAIGGHTFVGTVEPSRRSTIGSAVSGRVIELKVNKGDRVKKDQPIAQILTKQLDIQILVTRAERDLRAQELKELENGSRPEEVRQAEAQTEMTRSANEYAQSRLKRTRGLRESSVASEDQLLDDIRLANVAQQNMFAAEANLALIKAGPRAEKIAQARARLVAADEEVNRLLDQLEKHTIKAWFDGYVVKEHTETGQWIMSGDPVVEVVEVDEVEVEVMVLENYLPHLTIGSTAQVEITSLPQKMFEGRVTHVVPQADVRSRSFPVQVRLQNQALPDGQILIRPGMFTRVTLPVESKPSILLVPKDALVLGGAEPMVYVVDTDPKDPAKRMCRPVPVKSGVSFDSMIEVTGPLQAGQPVVIEGNERLRPGQEVVVQRVKGES